MTKSRSPFTARFLSDFTLGFSDGLTVPFALSAGLSSLGHTQTVIDAGLAELCAGSISMGIGGYLSAHDEARVARQNLASLPESEMEERRAILAHGADIDSASEQDDDCNEDIVRRHLEPLNLPSHMVSNVLAVVGQPKHGLQKVASQIQSLNSQSDESLAEAFVVRPWFSGMSIAIGYIIGGSIPLLPYCISSTIGTALAWSTGLCLVAMFAFGFSKNCLLSAERFSWSNSSLEGIRMLVLGSLAAVVAVICIRMIEGSRDDP